MARPRMLAKTTRFKMQAKVAHQGFGKMSHFKRIEVLAMFIEFS